MVHGRKFRRHSQISIFLLSDLNEVSWRYHDVTYLRFQSIVSMAERQRYSFVWNQNEFDDSTSKVKEVYYYWRIASGAPSYSGHVLELFRCCRRELNMRPSEFSSIQCALKNIQLLFFESSCETSIEFNDIWQTTFWGNTISNVFFFKFFYTSPFNCNCTTLWNTQVIFQHFTAARRTDRSHKCHQHNTINAVIKHATNNLKATVRNDIHMSEYRHPGSFAIGQLLRLRHQAGSQLKCSSTFAAALSHPAVSRFVPASLPECSNQLEGCWGHMSGAVNSGVPNDVRAFSD